MSESTFRPIPGYENLYSVSDKGEVFSHITDGLLAPKRSNAGYLRVTLCKGKNSHKTYSVHRLVAMTFIPNPHNKSTVNHINEVKTDNRVENLEWATNAEQNTHGTRIARAMAHTDWQKRNTKIDYATVAEKHDYQAQHMCGRKYVKAMKNGEVVGVFRSQREAASACGVHVSKVSACVNGNRKQTKGYSFQRVEIEEYPMAVTRKHFGDEDLGIEGDIRKYI